MPPDEVPIASLPAEEPPLVLPAPPPGGFWAAVGLCLLFLFVEFVLAIPFGVVGAIAKVWQEPWFLFGVHAIGSVGAALIIARFADADEVRRTAAVRGCRPAQLALALLLAPALIPPANAVADLVARGMAGPQPVAKVPNFPSVTDLFE